jgi:Glycosyl transferase family 2
MPEESQMASPEALNQAAIMNRPISIIMPCRNRADYLPLSMESILKQKYPGDLEFIIVENGRDGTEAVAERYGCHYFNVPRDEYPDFQNLSALWNFGIRQASHEMVLLQNAEVIHKTDGVLLDLVDKLREPKSYSVPHVESLDENGQFSRWYGHPSDNSAFGGGPILFRKAELLSFGGFEEGFYGYGFDDNFLYYLLTRHGIRRFYSDQLCAHLYHPRGPFDPTTGYANRALIRLLVFEIEHGLREPIANLPIRLRPLPREENLSAQIEALRPSSPEIYDRWALAWKNSDRKPDDDFAVTTHCANFDSQARHFVAEAAYSFLRAHLCRAVSQQAHAEGRLQWFNRADLCARIHETWCATALEASYADS